MQVLLELGKQLSGKMYIIQIINNAWYYCNNCQELWTTLSKTKVHFSPMQRIWFPSKYLTNAKRVTTSMSRRLTILDMFDFVLMVMFDFVVCVYLLFFQYQHMPQTILVQMNNGKTFRNFGPLCSSTSYFILDSSVTDESFVDETRVWRIYKI